jgi:membrane fusion protein, multidrug efflux system
VTEGVDPQGLLVPQQGVTRDQQGDPTALVVDAQGVARLRVLHTDRVIGDKWLVASGLSPGDRVIVDGLQRVRPDAPVKVVPAGSAAPPPPGAGG